MTKTDPVAPAVRPTIKTVYLQEHHKGLPYYYLPEDALCPYVSITLDEVLEAPEPFFVYNIREECGVGVPAARGRNVIVEPRLWTDVQRKRNVVPFFAIGLRSSELSALGFTPASWRRRKPNAVVSADTILESNTPTNSRWQHRLKRHTAWRSSLLASRFSTIRPDRRQCSAGNRLTSSQDEARIPMKEGRKRCKP